VTEPFLGYTDDGHPVYHQDRPPPGPALEPTTVTQRERLALDPSAVTQGLNARLTQLEARLVANEELARAGVREQFRVRRVLDRLEGLIVALTELTEWRHAHTLVSHRLLSERSTTMDLTVVLHIERKDEFYPEGEPEGLPGFLPTPLAATARLADMLADQTKHDEQIGWRVTVVTCRD
jgi:hypothetical protein